MHWWLYWWDLTVLAQIQALFSVVGAALAAAAVVYAWLVAKRQFKLADDQGKIIDKQLEILQDHRAIFLRLEESEKRQEDFLATQARIAQIQHEITVSQMARAPKLFLEVVDWERIFAEAGRIVECRWALGIHNSGDKPVSGGVYVTLNLPERREFEGVDIQLDTRFGTTRMALEDDPFRDLSLVAFCDKPVYPNGSVQFAEIVLRPDVESNALDELISHVDIEWAFQADDRRFPTVGFEKFTLDIAASQS